MTLHERAERDKFVHGEAVQAIERLMRCGAAW